MPMGGKCTATIYNKGLPGAADMLRMAAPKWLGTGARQFALSFGCTELSPVASSWGHVSLPQLVTHGMLRVRAPGVVLPHYARVLAFRGIPFQATSGKPERYVKVLARRILRNACAPIVTGSVGVLGLRILSHSPRVAFGALGFPPGRALRPRRWLTPPFAP